jgi:hypothetical protein
MKEIRLLPNSAPTFGPAVSLQRDTTAVQPEAHPEHAERPRRELVVEVAAVGLPAVLADTDQVGVLEGVRRGDVGAADLRHLEVFGHHRPAKVDRPRVALIPIAVHDGDRETPTRDVAGRAGVEQPE